MESFLKLVALNWFSHFKKQATEKDVHYIVSIDSSGGIYP